MEASNQQSSSIMANQNQPVGNAAAKQEREELDKRISDLEAYAKLWTARADELRLKCDEFYAKAKSVGNAAAMREALELAITIGDWCCAQTDDPLECCEFSCAYQVEPHGEAGADCPWKKIRAALAAPPRQCDVGTAEEQEKRWHKNCGPGIPNCKHCKVYGQAKVSGFVSGRGFLLSCSCKFVWAQMPYEAEEGGAE